jgi:serine/threonine-protein kinase
MLYRVLTGNRPFPSDPAALENEATVLFAIKTEVPAHPSEVDPRVPRALGDVAMALLEKDPAQRPQTAREFADRLRLAREAGASERAWTEPFDLEPATGRPASPPDVGQGEAVEAAEKLSARESPPADPAELGATRGAKPPVTGTAGPRFDVPTRAWQRAFDAGEAAGATEAPTPERDPMPTAVREAKARLAASAPRRGPGRLAIAGGALVAAVLALIVGAASMGGREKPAGSAVADVPARESAALAAIHEAKHREARRR